MSYWETAGASDEWYTPKYIFEAMGVAFDLDVANAAIGGANVPCEYSFGCDGLEKDWFGFVWMNPPFGGRNAITPWLDKFFKHDNGVALAPDRTSAPWWQAAANKADAVLFIAGKVKFERPDGTVGKSPSTGTTLFAAGDRGIEALMMARDNGLGFLAIDREDLVMKSYKLHQAMKLKRQAAYRNE